MNRIASLIALSLYLLIASPLACAFVGPPSLVPPNPVAGQLVSVAVEAGGCDSFDEGPTPITRNGNNIHIILPSVNSFDPEFCIFIPGTAVYPVGFFAAGTYTLQVDRTYPWFNGYVIETLGTLTFTVAPLASVPLLDGAGLFLLGFVLVLVALVSRRGCRSVVVLATMASVAVSMPVRSQTPPPTYALQVLLSTKPGAPTPDELIGDFQAGTGKPVGPPPLAGLAVESPQYVSYLMPLRAAGDFLANIQKYPNWSRAILERYVVVHYPETANLAHALAAFKNDPYVEAVYAVPTAQFFSANLTGFGVSQSPAGPVSSGPQYGRDDLNIDAAWQLAGGYALIADIDSGLYTAHPALRQFDANGQFLGGPFQAASSLNVGFEKPARVCQRLVRSGRR